MKNFKTFFYLILLGSSLTACSPRSYTPDTQNIPLISEKGETNVALSASTDRFEFQTSHGITNSIAIKANGGIYSPSFLRDSEFDFDDEIKGSGNFIELGLGYFKPLKGDWIFETYGIFGMGSAKNKYLFDTFNGRITENISTNIRRFGLQSSIGLKNEDFLFAFSSRFVNLSFQDIEGNLVFEQIDQQDYLRNNNNHFLIEPALTFGAIFNKLDVRLNLGLSLNVTDPEFRQYHTSSALIFNYSF